MAIGTNDTISKFGSETEVTVASPATIANNLFSVAGDTTAWTNSDNAPFASFALEFQFDTATPTVGAIDLFAQLTDIQGTNDPGVPDANFPHTYLGTFPLDFTITFDNDYWSLIESVELPNMHASQIYHFYLRNNGTGSTMGVNWDLFIIPKTFGPAA